MRILLLLRVSVCIQYLIAIYKLNMNTVLIPRYTQRYNMTGIRISSFSLFCIKRSHENLFPFLLLRNSLFFDFKRKLVAMDMWSSILFSLRVCETQKVLLVYFSYFFKLRQILDLDVLRSIDNSRLLLRGRHSAYHCKSSWLKVWWASFSEFISLWRITKRKNWKPVSVLAVINDNFVINTTHVRYTFWSDFVILKLPQNNMLNMHFQFL